MIIQNQMACPPRQFVAVSLRITHLIFASLIMGYGLAPVTRGSVHSPSLLILKTKMSFS